jgi:hypothetical protein
MFTQIIKNINILTLLVIAFKKLSVKFLYFYDICVFNSKYSVKCIQESSKHFFDLYRHYYEIMNNTKHLQILQTHNVSVKIRQKSHQIK